MIWKWKWNLWTSQNSVTLYDLALNQMKGKLQAFRNKHLPYSLTHNIQKAAFTKVHNLSWDSCGSLKTSQRQLWVHTAHWVSQTENKHLAEIFFNKRWGRRAIKGKKGKYSELQHNALHPSQLVCAWHKPLETRHINTTIVPRRSLSDPPPPSCSSWGDKCKIREFQNSTDQLPVLKAIRFKPRDIPDSQCRLSATVTLAIIHHSQKCSPPPPQRNLGNALHSYYKILYSYFTGLWIQVEENLKMALS